ncbi:MAG TPA: FAD/NAD(P)-binding protein [Acidimicrobiia bacterium]
METVEADYVVIGAGAVGMSFADVVVAESDATVVLVDRRDRPGGHWNDAYSFVRLHQPSAYYGVGSTELGRRRVDVSGTNAGLNELASGVEVCDYFDRVMQDTLVSSGRVRYFPMSEYGDGVIRSLLTGERTAVRARHRVVDAAYVGSEIPSQRPPPYAAADDVDVVPVNSLSRVRHPYEGYVVVGGGKTGIDACQWLLDREVDASTITWIRPRDPWLLNRSTIQGGGEFALRTLECFATQIEVIAAASSLDDLVTDLEAADLLLRIDPTHRPTMFRGATVTHAEIECLRRIDDVVRMGYVSRIDAEAIVLEHGTVPTSPGRLHVDCTAAGVRHRPAVPVFDGDRITLQYLVWGGHPTLSAAVAARIELVGADDGERNALCPPLPITGDARDIPRYLLADMQTRSRWSKVPELADWLTACRLNPAAGIMSSLQPDDAAALAAVARRRASLRTARENLARLLGAAPVA